MGLIELIIIYVYLLFLNLKILKYSLSIFYILLFVCTFTMYNNISYIIITTIQ